MHLFAVIANSAGCEHVFSNFGIAHTKLWNKIDAEWVHKMAVVGMELKHVDCEAGLAHNHKKQKSGMDNTVAVDLPPTNPYLPNNTDSDTTEFHQYADNLIWEAQDDNNVPEDAISPLTIPTGTAGEPQTPHAPCQQCTTPASSSSLWKTHILLAKLFNYTLSPEDGLEFYCPGSKKNLEVDLVAHELSAAEESSDCIQVDT